MFCLSLLWVYMFCVSLLWVLQNINFTIHSLLLFFSPASFIWSKQCYKYYILQHTSHKRYLWSSAMPSEVPLSTSLKLSKASPWENLHPAHQGTNNLNTQEGIQHDLSAFSPRHGRFGSSSLSHKMGREGNSLLSLWECQRKPATLLTAVTSCKKKVSKMFLKKKGLKWWHDKTFDWLFGTQEALNQKP